MSKNKSHNCRAWILVISQSNLKNNSKELKDVAVAFLINDYSPVSLPQFTQRIVENCKLLLHATGVLTQSLAQTQKLFITDYFTQLQLCLFPHLRHSSHGPDNVDQLQDEVDGRHCDDEDEDDPDALNDVGEDNTRTSQPNT